MVIDGFISTIAALLATEICSAARDYLIAAHDSFEIEHRFMLDWMERAPLLKLDLHQGEGTGEAMAMQPINDAAGVLDEMATFAEAGVAGKDEPVQTQARNT